MSTTTDREAGAMTSTETCEYRFGSVQHRPFTAPVVSTERMDGIARCGCDSVYWVTTYRCPTCSDTYTRTSKCAHCYL